MSLSAALSTARTEEDVKDAYIKALGLKSYFKGLVDIQTEEVWFEAKAVSTPPIVMFAQLFFYVRAARKRGEPIPAFLAVIDREKAAIMPTEKALALLDDKTIVWPKSGSGAGKELAGQVAPYVQAHIVEYEIAHDEPAFIKAVKDAIRERRIIRTPITPDNLRQVFDRWVDMIGSELGVSDPVNYAVLFFADIMHDGTNEYMSNLPARMLMTAAGPTFLLNGKTYELASKRGYQNFWAIYHRPPEAKHRHYLLERRDSLLPIDEQKFKGAYYTPLHIVDKAYDELKATLGDNWQDRYIVWDMCAGVGNLEAKHSNLRNVFMSTLDQADVTIMKSNPAFAGAEIFQYDYLNDDITDFGEIDYSLSNKLPAALRQAIAEANKGKNGAKPILVLINPPYAEATGGGLAVPMAVNQNKLGVANTLFARAGMAAYGKATNELFMQFIARIDQELPRCKLAIFSKVKYISTPTLDAFRKVWKAEYLGGFAVHSRSFEGLKGDFPIGFLIWDTSKDVSIDHVAANMIDRVGNLVGEKKFLNYDGLPLLTDWVSRPLSNSQQVIPLKSAITPATATKDLRGDRWSDGAIGWLKLRWQRSSECHCQDNVVLVRLWQRSRLFRYSRKPLASRRRLFRPPPNQADMAQRPRPISPALATALAGLQVRLPCLDAVQQQQLFRRCRRARMEWTQVVAGQPFHPLYRSRGGRERAFRIELHGALRRRYDFLTRGACGAQRRPRVMAAFSRDAVPAQDQGRAQAQSARRRLVSGAPSSGSLR